MTDSRIGTTGLHDNIDELEYHADRSTLSQSGIKVLLQAPALFKYQLDNPPPPKRHYDLGSVAHSIVLGVGAQPEAVHRYDAKTGEDLGEADDMRSPSTRAHADQIRAAGNIPLLRKEVAQAEAMAESLDRHRLAMELLADGAPEMTMYAEHEPTGIMCRGRVDWLTPELLVDLKTTDTADPDQFGKKANSYGYHIQNAMYVDLARLLGHPAKAFAFVLIEKTPPYLVEVVQLGAPSIRYGRKEYTRGLEILRDCREVDLWPSYSDDDTYRIVNIPDWAFARRSDT